MWSGKEGKILGISRSRDKHCATHLGNEIKNERKKKLWRKVGELGNRKEREREREREEEGGGGGGGERCHGVRRKIRKY